MELLVSLKLKPADNTTVRFGVVTSDPSTAEVVHPTLVVFSTDNWDIGTAVTIRGVYKEDRNVSATRYFVEFTYLGSDDVRFSGHVKTVGHEVVNKEDANFLYVEVSPESLDFTTHDGGTVQLLVSLTQAPLNASTVSFAVGTSDPTSALVLYPSTVMFTSDNWNTGLSVYILGVDSCSGANATTLKSCSIS